MDGVFFKVICGLTVVIAPRRNKLKPSNIVQTRAKLWVPGHRAHIDQIGSCLPLTSINHLQISSTITTLIISKYLKDPLKPPYFMGKSMVSCRLSLKPIHWASVLLSSGGFHKRGSLKSSILIRFSLINHPSGGTPIVGLLEAPIYCHTTKWPCCTAAIAIAAVTDSTSLGLLAETLLNHSFCGPTARPHSTMDETWMKHLGKDGKRSLIWWLTIH